jgi:enoyl-CoA hydratase
VIAWHTEDTTTYLALNRLPCNEIGSAMLQGLEDFLDAFDAETTRALIITSEIPGAFCAGADLRELHTTVTSRTGDDLTAELRRFLDRIHRVMNQLDALPCTTIGVIGGLCFGGGFELALTCDVLIAEKHARFAFPELRLGLIPGFGGIPRLKRDVGNAIVRDVLLTGRSINARKALEIGLVSQMVPKGDGLKAAKSLARQAAKLNREATVTAKAFMKPIPHAELEQEKELFLSLFTSPAVEEALSKFVSSTDARPYLP